ncbi:hypothetical protein [Clostridium sp.]|jgi:hypothetical protein|uniref:hypothetical protein n=1 Tax=Clostridium sp. TaxID=1506 RepID=UPI003EEBD515
MLIITIQIMAVLTMLTFMFTAIWGFILLIKIYGQLRYKNYLMEKLIQSTSKLSLSHKTRECTKDHVVVEDTFKPNNKEILES